VLVIEDEPDLVRVLEYNLRQAGMEVRSAGRARDGLALARAEPPDLVLLDLMLPDSPGTEVCRALRADPRTRTVPIIMVTARTEELDRVVGFELGADDYVTKPFSVRELVLRVRAVLRRAEAAQAAPPAEVVKFGCLRIEPEAHRVFVNDEEVVLTALEFRLLVTLVERRNRVQSRDTLLQDVWGTDFPGETRTVDVHVAEVRKKLGDDGPQVETVRGVGYRLVPPPRGAAGPIAGPAVGPTVSER